MKVMMADSLGMCFGVRDAVAMALSSPHRSDLTILGELVHNTEILRRLREAGIQSVPSIDTPVALFAIALALRVDRGAIAKSPLGLGTGIR